MKKGRGLAAAWLASVAVHIAVGGVFSWMARRSSALELTPAAEISLTASAAIVVELPAVGAGSLVEQQSIDALGEPPRVSGGDAIAHVDTNLPGHGGDLRVTAPALNLADRDERMRLSPDLVSHLDRDQVQRLRVARVRQSWEDRRSTTHPAELTLVVTGAGNVVERRAVAPQEPSRGALQFHLAAMRGAALGVPLRGEEDDRAQRYGGAQLGSLEEAPGAGLLNAPAGHDHHASAPIGSARPDVTRAAVAVPATDPARPKDTLDSDQEVATTVRSLVHASTAGGLEGEGQGGSDTGGEAGAGGASGAGSRARPLGIGDGDVVDRANDPRLLSYYRLIHAKIAPLWADAFPKSALLEIKQGTVILEFVVFADGHTSVVWPPIRPSGIDEFDRNCADAIRRASPLPPIPRVLGVRSLRIRWPFIVDNPIIK